MKAVSLHDVKDVEGFVKATIKRSRIPLTPHEWEELVAEGMAIMCELAARYNPALESNPAKASFAGYAHYLLPRKLGDAWHKMNPNHVLRTQPDGKRKYEYLDPAESWDRKLHHALTGEHPLDERKLRTPGEFVPQQRASA